MTTSRLGEFAVAHYGKALKAAEREGHGAQAVFGSSGIVGRHDKALVSHPTIIVGRKGSVGVVTYAPEGGWPIDTAYYLELPDPERVDLRYLYWALSRAGLDKRAITTSIPGLNRDELYRTRVRLPSFAEQRRIAAVLDKADGIRRKRRESIKLLDEFLRSAFLEMFGDPVMNEKGWEVVRLGEISDIQGGLQVSAGRADTGQEAPYLRVANVYRDRLDLREIKNIRVTNGELLRTNLVAGDLLIVEGHGNPDEIGRCAMWDGSITSCVHQNHLIRARFDSTVAAPEYVSAFLNSASGRRQMLRFGKTTSGLNTITTGNVKRVRLLLPPLDLQWRFAKLRSKVVAVQGRMEAGGQTVDDLFDSLVQRAFGGASDPGGMS